MQGVNASVAARCRDLKPIEREFVRRVGSVCKTLGFPLLTRSQITMNAISLCEGSISATLFLTFGENRPEFQSLLTEYRDALSRPGPWATCKRVEQLDFSLKMTLAKLRKARASPRVDKTRKKDEEEERKIHASGEDPEGDTTSANVLFANDVGLPQWWEFLRNHFTIGQQNVNSFMRTGDVHGFRYPDEQLRKLYCLTSLSGHLMYELIHRTFGFPSWTTVREYRKELQSQLGLTSDVLDGQRSSVEHLLSSFPFRSSDKRCVLSIDATALKCNFGVKSNGTVLGTVVPTTIATGQAHEICTNLSEFFKFHGQNCHQIAKAVFLVMLNPVATEEKEIPLALFPYHQGQVDSVILGKLLNLNQITRELGLEVIGNAFDGDAKFTPYATSLVNRLMELAVCDMTETVQSVFSKVIQGAEIRPFFDPNHQVKCDRYRRTLPNPVCVFFNMPPTVQSKDFIEALELPPYVLSGSEMYKMDDSLPRMLFNVPNLIKSLDVGRLDLFIALFPSTAMIVAIMDESLSRSDRIHLLLCGWSFMFLYYLSMLKYKPDGSDSQTIRKSGDRPISLWHTDHVTRYLSSVTCIVHTLLDTRDANLGALGSHHNENCFGQVKRLSAYDESVERFKKGVEKALLMKKLFNELGLHLCPRGRISMSGAKIPAESVEDIHPIGYYLFLSKSLLELVTPYDVEELGNAIDGFGKANELRKWDKPNDSLLLLPKSLVNEFSTEARQRRSKVSGVTLRNIRAVSTAGGCCKERFISASQVNSPSGTCRYTTEESL